MPFEYWTIAPGAGQAMRQPGSVQCMHWSLRISQLKRPSVSCSLKRIRFQKFDVMSGIVWYVPACVVASGGRSFHSWHATSQALHPMQVDVSTSFAMIGCDLIPALVGPADERMMSSVAAIRLFQASQGSPCI